MCNCFSLTAASGDGGRTSGTASRSRDPQPVARVRAEAELWVDVHAHPGRCFLRGMDAADPAVALLGSDDIDRALADLAAGQVDVACFATVADLRVLTIDPASGGIRAGRAFEPGEAYTDHQRQLGALQDLASQKSVEVMLEPGDLRSARGRRGMMITCEGADFLEGQLERVEQAHEQGVRSVTLVHYRVNELGDIQTEAPEHDGLSRFGADVVREMNRLGMIVDLAHATFEMTRGVLDVSSAPVMISHSHLASGEDAHPRLLSLEHARAVTRAGGLIGAWPAGVAITSFEGYLDEILRLIDALGVDHVAIGTDMDANYKPVVDSYKQYPSIAEGLHARGVGHDEIGRVMGGNFVQLFDSVRG